MKHRWLIAVGTAGFVALSAVPASAGSAKSVTGPKHQVLSVSKTRGLVDGQVVTVRGRKYDKGIGIYVAFCVLNAKGTAPGPCGGGINMTAEALSSYWISSNPPPYGESLAKPFGRGGRFSVKLRVTRFIGDVDCKVTRCGVVTKADHTRVAYRKADVRVRVRFQ